MTSTEGNVRRNNIYISKMPNEMSGNQLWPHFSKFGKVVMVRIESDVSDEYQRAFISFRDTGAASRVLRKKFHTVNGFRLPVFPIDNWNQPAADNACYCWPSDGKLNKTTDIAMPLNGSNMLSLNDDCLEIICASLNLRDQVRFANVCERFREVFTMFSKREYKTLQLELMREMALWEKRDFFRHAGSNIEHIIGEISCEVPERMVQCIVVHCPNVKKLCLDNTAMMPDCFTTLMWSMPKLEELTWSELNYVDEYTKSMAHLNKLRSLSICGGYDFRGKKRIQIGHLFLIKEKKKYIVLF
uniref:RRM domain-containing protein n=1 Tax=Ceratitis capitata TaxID=7213 RepID=W8AN46_CERCA